MILRKGLALLLTVLLAADRSLSFVGASREGGNAAADDASEGVGDGSCANDPSSPSDSDESCLPSTAQEKPRDDGVSDGAGYEDDSSGDSSEDEDGSYDWFTRENGHTAGNNENRTNLDMWFNLGCDEVFGRGPRPVPTGAQFAEYIRLYNSIVADESLRLDASAEGIFVGLEVRQAEGKGRGIFATSRIERGTRVRDIHTKTAIFYDPDHYRKFILELEWSLHLIYCECPLARARARLPEVARGPTTSFLSRHW